MNNLSLVEKYRPYKLKNIKDQESILNAIKKTIVNKDIPHLLFYGQPGVGKTTTAITLIKYLFSKQNYQDRVLELNASDERGIQIVREKIKNFAKFSINNDKTSANFKVIILDEADALTIESQLALRYIIEEYASITRFIIICNYINKIIEPLLSRCAIFRFKPIQKKNIISTLTDISIKENINISKKNINNIYNITNGDLRTGINLLEKFKFKDTLEINDNTIKDKIIKYINLSINFDKCTINKYIKELLNSGINCHEIIINIINYIEEISISDEQKCKLLIELSNLDTNLNNGSDDYIILIYLSIFIFNI